VDGTKLTDHWFPTIAADVFISHSRSDRESAIKCAGWLKTEFDLEPFIDSCVWGHAEELLRIIDNDYCLNADRQTYSYRKRNRSTSHVHMMLSSALSAMLDATECVFFIKTDNSISSEESVYRTQSPWLFFELGTMKIIRRRKPARMNPLIENFARGEIKASRYYEAEYEIPLSELTRLDHNQLLEWCETCELAQAKQKDALDMLYELAPE
jgi:hypothetical protein